MEKIFNQVKKKSPRIHSITNYVTANDVANIILAIGAKPIMADEEIEVAQIQHNCDGLNINMGTINQNRARAMISAGLRAQFRKHPIILDPVGVGGSDFRMNVLSQMLERIHFDVIKGNISEMKSVILKTPMTSGVDELPDDKLTPENRDDIIAVLKDYSKKTDTILVVTGEVDLVVYLDACYMIKNGHPMMSSYTGSGCQLSGLIASFIASNGDKFKATALAVMTYGIAGELAYQEGIGNVSYKNCIIDTISTIDYKRIEENMNYEII